MFTEPIKGAKKSGFRGGMKGIAKGITGLVMKPVGGTIQLFTKTARGIKNTPGTLLKRMTKNKVKKN